MTDFVVHDASGRILRWGECPAADVEAQADAGETALAIASAPSGDASATHYLVDGSLTARPELPAPPATISVGDDLEITGLPENASWKIWDVTDAMLAPAEAAAGVVVSDGLLTEPMDDAGTYRLEIEPPWPYRAVTAEIEVT